MLTSILGQRLSWHIGGWVFEPAVVGPNTIDYVLKEGPHAGRHAIQRFYYQRVAPGVETTVWYEESGAATSKKSAAFITAGPMTGPEN